MKINKIKISLILCFTIFLCNSQEIKYNIYKSSIEIEGYDVYKNNKEISFYKKYCSDILLTKNTLDTLFLKKTSEAKKKYSYYLKKTFIYDSITNDFEFINDSIVKNINKNDIKINFKKLILSKKNYYCNDKIYENNYVINSFFDTCALIRKNIEDIELVLINENCDVIGVYRLDKKALCFIDDSIMILKENEKYTLIFSKDF